MSPFTPYPMLRSLVSPFRRSQQKTLALVIAAIAEGAQVSSLTLAAHLAPRLRIPVGSALRRFYRLLANPRIEDQVLRLLGAGRRLLIAIDWTAVGQAVAAETPSVHLPCQRKGPRLSLLRVGMVSLWTLA